MHTVAIRKQFATDSREVVKAVYQAFCAAKDATRQQYSKGMVFNNMATMMPWFSRLVDERTSSFPSSWKRSLAPVLSPRTEGAPYLAWFWRDVGIDGRRRESAGCAGGLPLREGELPENASRSVIRSAKATFRFFRDGLLSATAC
jgi:hypothetical protein